MAEIYLSYSRAEREIAARVADILRNSGYQVWWDAALEPGSSFDTVVHEQLQSAKAVVVLLSNRSVNSQWVRHEAVVARETNKLVTILVEPSVNIPLLLFGVEYADGTKDLAAAVANIGPRLERLTGRKPLSTAIPKPRNLQPEETNRGFAFLSYCEEDTDFRDNLVEFLKTQNFAYWEYGESDRDYDMLLFLELEKRIAESTLVLSILSENWKNSVWCVKEYFFAKEAGKPVFLLKAKPLGPTLAIAGEHFISFENDVGKGFDRLSRELKRRGL